MKGFRLSIFLLALFSLSALADENTALAKEYPELQQLLLAHDIVQARVYEEISLANASDIAAIGQISVDLESEGEGERDYTELVEYIRIAVQLIFADLHPELDTDAEPTIH